MPYTPVAEIRASKVKFEFSCELVILTMDPEDDYSPGKQKKCKLSNNAVNTT